MSRINANHTITFCQCLMKTSKNDVGYGTWDNMGVDHGLHPVRTTDKSNVIKVRESQWTKAVNKSRSCYWLLAGPEQKHQFPKTAGKPVGDYYIIND